MRASAASLTAAPAGERAAFGFLQRIGQHERDEQQRPLAIVAARGPQGRWPALVQHLAQHPDARFAALLAIDGMGPIADQDRHLGHQAALPRLMTSSSALTASAMRAFSAA
jgi:hypothetical protein